jgi:hypothetical protein
VCGAIDCTHIEVELPRCTRSTDYFDKDSDHSCVIQVVVDTNM